MGEKVTLPADLRAKLAAAATPVPLYDEGGDVVGYYMSPGRMASIEAERKALYDAAALVPEEELDAAERAGGSRTMEDVFRLLERK